MSIIKERAPVHPGRILKNLYLQPLGISNTKLAETLAVSRKAISNIVNERESITPEMALRLSRALDTTPDVWLNLQKNYDLWHAANDTHEWQKIKPLIAPDERSEVVPA